MKKKAFALHGVKIKGVSLIGINYIKNNTGSVPKAGGIKQFYSINKEKGLGSGIAGLSRFYDKGSAMGQQQL